MIRTRDPKTTRHSILQSSFEEIYFKGFQAASVNNIIKKTKLTKGAFFHHFKTKLDLGYAVVEELLTALTFQIWIEPFKGDDNTISVLEEMYLGRITAFKNAPAILGCPLNNLSQEMSPIDDGFRERIQRVFELWINGFAEALENGKQAGVVSNGINSQLTAFTLISMIEGAISIAKGTQDIKFMDQGLLSYRNYLQLLKP